MVLDWGSVYNINVILKQSDFNLSYLSLVFIYFFYNSLRGRGERFLIGLGDNY